MPTMTRPRSKTHCDAIGALDEYAVVAYETVRGGVLLFPHPMSGSSVDAPYYPLVLHVHFRDDRLGIA